MWNADTLSGIRHLRETLETVPPARPDHSPVLAALERLRPQDRELLRLDAWDDLSVDQIADVLHISPGAARVRLHRARRRLAAALDSHLPHTAPAPAAETDKETS